MKQNRVISGAVAALVLAALLAGCGSTAAGASSADSTPAATEAAGSEATAPTAEPQTEAALPDGVYTAEFETDSSMVHANEACDGKGTLTVADGKMTFHVSLASKKIVNLYLGTAEDAPSHESDWLQPTTDTVTYSVRLIGPGVDGVAEKQQHINFAAGNHGGNLLGTAACTGVQAANRQPTGIVYHFARHAGGNQFVLRQNTHIGCAELGQKLFAGIMGNQCDPQGGCLL